MQMTPAGRAQLAIDEGKRSFVYDDKTSLPILHGEGGGIPTIGIGRNLRDTGLSDDEIELLFTNDINRACQKIAASAPWATEIDPVWQDVLLNIQFNTGNVLAWPMTLAAMRAGDAVAAAQDVLNSKAAAEAPERYKRLAAAVINRGWNVS